MPIETVRATVPDLYLEYLAGTIMQGYRKSANLCKEAYHNKNVRDNALPWMRRGFIEEGLLGVPLALEDEVTIEQVQNSWWWHAEITIGQILIAQAIAPDVDKSIRPSNYKSVLTSQTQQLLLFPDESEEEEEVSPKRIFAALVHGPNSCDSTRPAFAAIRVPSLGEDGQIREYFPGVIDLMDEFPHQFTPIIDENTNAASAEEIIQDAAFPEPLEDEETGE